MNGLKKKWSWKTRWYRGWRQVAATFNSVSLCQESLRASHLNSRFIQQEWIECGFNSVLSSPIMIIIATIIITLFFVLFYSVEMSLVHDRIYLSMHYLFFQYMNWKLFTWLFSPLLPQEQILAARKPSKEEKKALFECHPKENLSSDMFTTTAVIERVEDQEWWEVRGSNSDLSWSEVMFFNGKGMWLSA